jgi:predicted CXXCH cytochrome family protein
MALLSRTSTSTGPRAAGGLALALAVGIAVATVAAGPTQTPAVSQKPAPAGSQKPAIAAPGSCLQCHAALTRQPVTHSVAAECGSCHVQDKTNAHKFKMAADGEKLCVGCHEVKKPSDKFVHGPVAVGDCVSCHNPHGAAKAKLLKTGTADLCQSCHVEMKALLAEKRSVHAPVKDACTDCHDPHASPFKYQLKAEGSALCLLCHKQVQTLIASSPVKHDAVTMEKGCRNCHEAHATDVKPLLKGPSMTMCLACHDREVPMPGGKLQDIKAWLAANTNLHGPIREKDCVGCHQPHESAHFRLLKQDYPAKFYSPFDPKNYELCFACHQPDLVRVERTTTLTGFRDGDRNLHFVHVNQPEKGRTCRACHEVHSSPRAKHIRDTVPFGSWALPIKFEAGQTGGRCAPGCHVAYDYDRNKPAAKVGGR